MLTGGVSGRAEIRHVQGLLLKTELELEKKLLAETRDAVKPVKPEVVKAAARLPSGYAPVLAPSVRVSSRVTGGRTVKAKVKVTAKGRRANRDVRRLDLGQLRHPVFGNRDVWKVTAVRPRFVSDPLDDMTDRVVKGARKAADEVADTIVRG